MRSDLAALAAVLLWGSLASLAILLDTVPPLLMTGIGLVVGSLIALPVSGFRIRRLLPRKRVLLVGVYGLLGYHFALFAGLQNAPSVQANLVGASGWLFLPLGLRTETRSSSAGGHNRLFYSSYFHHPASHGDRPATNADARAVRCPDTSGCRIWLQGE